MAGSSRDTISRIAWIGAGVMGRSMAGHLLQDGFDVVVHSRRRESAAELLFIGAKWADSPATAASGADVAISMVGYPADVESVHLGVHGTLRAKRPPRLIIDMTTSRPGLAVEIHTRAKLCNAGCLDAPVSGGDIGARNRALSIMCGGEQADFDRALPILQRLGKTIVLHGPAGTGQHAKMVNQILIATNMIGVCEGLIYARRAGLDPRCVIESVGSGAAGSWSINNLGPRMLDRDFNPGFFVEHFIKDLGIALDEARRMKLTLPGLTLAKQLYDAVVGLGHARLGTQSLLLAYEHMNGLSADTSCQEERQS
jgi:3-hydroxyisobutyrate dehydrogenase